MFLIRKLEKQDLDAVCRMEEETFSMPWSRDDFMEMIEADYAYYYVAIDEKNGPEPVACCGIRIIAGEGQITNVVVAQRQRKRGIAYLLLDRAIAETQQAGAEVFTLEVRVSNQAAIHLYEKLGFKSEGIRPDFYEKPEEDALIMWRR